MEIARLVIGTILLAAAALLSVKLYNGSWLSLIARPRVTKRGTFYPEGTINTGKRAAWVMVACFAVVATLMAYEMAKLADEQLFAQAATFLSNVSLVAFCASLLYTLFAGRSEQSYQDRFKKEGARLLLLLLGTCVVMTVVAVLFA